MNEIVPGLFLGEHLDCLSHPEFPSDLCVHEEIRCRDGWIPVYKEGSGRADVAALDRAANWITLRMNLSKPVLVHCHKGVERAPLTMVWWLWRTGRCESISAAYKLVMEKRPVVEDRRHWLPEEFRA